MPQILPVIGAVTTVVGTVASISQGHKASKEQDKLNKLAATRERKQMIRRSVVARASTLNAGVAAGAGGSSGLAGGLSSISSQTGGNLGFATQASAIGSNIARHQQNASLWKGVASLGGAVYNLGGAPSLTEMKNTVFPNATGATA